jgi:transcriptional regulator with XRE-family HTH domain
VQIPTSEQLSRFGAYIKSLRLQKGFTQRSLASHANLNPRSIEPWEQGVQVPTVSNLKQLARALNVGFEALSIVLFAPDDSTLRSLSGLELMRVAFHKTLTPPSSGPLNVTLIELSRSLSTLRSLLGGDPITFAKQFEQFLPQVNAALRTTMDAKSKVALRRVNAWAWIDAAFFFLREKQRNDSHRAIEEIANKTRRAKRDHL